MLGKVQHVRLFGATAQERELSRGETDIRIDFDLVADADSYRARLNGAVGGATLMAGDSLSIGASNTLAAIEVRAEKAGQQPGPWSDVFKTVTRTPLPPSVKQLPYELSGFGVVLGWSVPAGFPGGGSASVTLFRDAQLIEQARPLDDRYVDAHYQQGASHQFAIQTVVPPGAVPENVLGGPNVSFISAPLTVYGPARYITARQTDVYVRRIHGVEVVLLGRFGYS